MENNTPKSRSVRLRKYFPILEWGASYTRQTLEHDLIAAIIVTIMLIPQSLAYALLAGLPPEVGLYASILPLIAYALFGTSRSLAVGPVAVVSLMTAAAVGKLALPGSAEYLAAAVILALLSGLILLAMGVLRLGFLANFLSHPVISGFIFASGLIIAASQLKHILGIDAHGHTLPEIVGSLITHLPETNVATMLIGISATAFLFWSRKGLKSFLAARGIVGRRADIAVRVSPVVAVVLTTLATWGFGLGAKGVQIVGVVPQGFPPLSVPQFDADIWWSLFGSAALISVIGFVESVSVAQTLAAKRRQRIMPNQELIGLGASNIASAVSGGYPVTGGFARSVVNFDAGARTPAAGAFTAVGIAVATVALTPLLFFLPKATLAATIIVAVMSLVDVSVLRKAWNYSVADFLSVAVTVAITLLFGVEFGVSAGVVTSILLLLYKTSRPHIAEVGCVPGTEHFRNINRHEVTTDPHLLTIRVDESLYFANARFLEDYIYNRILQDQELRHVVLMCSAVNEIDMSALHSLEAINARLSDIDVKLHLSEVKGPVMDRLEKTSFHKELTGQVFLSQFQAMSALCDTDRVAREG